MANHTPDHPSDASPDVLDDAGKPLAIYVLYLVALFTGVPFFVGVILAYIFRSRGPEWTHSHFEHHISLFWRFVLGSIALGMVITISIPLMFVLVGVPMIVVAGLGFVYLWIWMLIRCVKGIADVRQQVPYRAGPGWGL